LHGSPSPLSSFTSCWYVSFNSLSLYIYIHFDSFSFPFLTTKDVASYIIARTLGVIDDTKASTSDRGSLVSLYDSVNTTPITITTEPSCSSAASPSSGSADYDGIYSSASHDFPQILVRGDGGLAPVAGGAGESDGLSPTDAFADGNLRLSGVGVFSPAVSRSSSPVMERNALPGVVDSRSRGRRAEGSEGEEVDDSEGDWGDSEGTPGGLGREASWGSLSMDSSFTIIDRDSGSEDTGVGLRKRQVHDDNLGMPA
jgi:hypothetical protein